MPDVKLEDLLDKESTNSFVPEQKIIQSDMLMYIYTSGTTGLPKYLLKYIYPQ